MEIKSDFSDYQPIPVQYTCEGNNFSPSLTFLTIPSGAKSLVLIV